MKLTKKQQAIVSSVTLENYEGQRSYWVELRDGWCFDDEGAHCFAEDTQALVRDSLKLVRPCNCAHHCAAVE